MAIRGNALSPRIIGAYKDFFSDCGAFTDAVTILLKHRHPTHHVCWRNDMAKPTAHWFAERLNKKIYGRSYLGGHKQLGMVISYEIGGLAGRPHFHIVIERPKHLKQGIFRQTIKKVFNQMDWRTGTIDIRDYKNSLFLRYMCKGDFEKIIAFFNSKK
jgi:hypothetical protein